MEHEGPETDRLGAVFVRRGRRRLKSDNWKCHAWSYGSVPLGLFISGPISYGHTGFGLPCYVRGAVSGNCLVVHVCVSLHLVKKNCQKSLRRHFLAAAEQGSHCPVPQSYPISLTYHTKDASLGNLNCDIHC
eukprot:2610773-Rhodomonas_salina.1